MYTLNLANNVEQKLTKAAQHQGKTIDQVLKDKEVLILILEIGHRKAIYR